MAFNLIVSVIIFTIMLLSGSLRGNSHLGLTSDNVVWQSGGNIHIGNAIIPGSNPFAFEGFAYTKGNTSVITYADRTYELDGTHPIGICVDTCFAFWHRDGMMYGASLGDIDDSVMIMPAQPRYVITRGPHHHVMVGSQTNARILSLATWPPHGFDHFDMPCDVIGYHDGSYIAVRGNIATNMFVTGLGIDRVSTRLLDGGAHAIYRGEIMTKPYDEYVVGNATEAWIVGDMVYSQARSGEVIYLPYLLLAMICLIFPGFGFFVYRLYSRTPVRDMKMRTPIYASDTTVLYKRYGGSTIRVLKIYKSGVTSEELLACGAIMQSMDHVNVVSGYATDDGIVMDYYPRGDLRTASFDINTAALQICEGMIYILSKISCHGDLKLAHCLVDGQNNIKITGYGTPKRSKLWMAPEIVGSPSTADEKSDVWSYGLLLWELYAHDVVPESDLQIDPEWPLAGLIDMCLHPFTASRPDFMVIRNILRRIE